MANGDITTPDKAREVLAYTGADAVMIGRAAQGRPWICREIDHFLRTGEYLPAPYVDEVRALMDEHLQAHYAFYGEYLGVRTARKHIGWYVRDLPGGEDFRQRMNLLETCIGYNTAPPALLKKQWLHKKNYGTNAASQAQRGKINKSRIEPAEYEQRKYPGSSPEVARRLFQ